MDHTNEGVLKLLQDIKEILLGIALLLLGGILAGLGIGLAGLTGGSFNSLIKVFEKMYEKINGSIMIISHQERILDIADRIILIANGQVKAEGSKEEIMPLILGEGGSGPCNILKDKM